MNTPEYYRQYYLKNKERITQRNKEYYANIKKDPIQLALHRKLCREANARFRKNHPKEVQISRKEQSLKRKLKAFDLIGSRVCNNCGCDEVSFLEINHINGGGCKEWRENGNYIVDRILTNRRKTDDLEILCRICNALDFLKRKNFEESLKFRIIWQKLTNKKAVKL